MRHPLEHLHGFLDALEHLPCPGDLARDRREVPRHRGIILVTLVIAGGVLDLATVAREDMGVLLGNA